MIDTHAHLLPGIDDGAASLEDALRLAEDAVAVGVQEVVCTPHLGRREQAPSAVRALSVVTHALADAGSPLRLHLGYELTFSFAAGLSSEEELRAHSLAGAGTALLVEMPYQGWPPMADEAVFRWRLQGFLPILAHPERNPRVQRDPDSLDRLLELGAVAQGTAPSLLGSFGPDARRCLLELISGGRVSLFASDAHGGRAGYTHFARALAELKRLAPGADVATMTLENPRRVLSGESLLPLEPVTTTRLRWLLPRWR